MSDTNDTAPDLEGDDGDNGEGQEKAAASPFHEPPQKVQDDPDYHKTYMEQWAHYIFAQRLVDYQGRQERKTAIKTGQFEIIRDAGANAGRAALILNGFAAGGLLTFMGNTEAIPADAFVPALMCFSIGAALGACLFASTYLSQMYFTEFRNKPIAKIYRGIAIGCFVVGMAAFVSGVVWGGLQFKADPTPAKPAITNEQSPTPAKPAVTNKKLN